MRKNELNSKEEYVVIISIDGMANYYLDDPKVRMPHLRGLIEQGVRAQSAVSIYPSATWAIHTSIATGVYPRKHGVLGNWVIERSTKQVGEYFGDRMWSKEQATKQETFYDAAKRVGWSTASVCWPVTRKALSLDFNIPEFYEQELFEAHVNPTLWQELKDKGLPVDSYGEWSRDHGRGSMQDWLTTEISKYLIHQHRPNLLMLHYLLPDSLQHDYGTKSPEVYWSLEYIDERMGEIVGALKAEGIWEQTTLFVVSDHGFVDTTSTTHPNVLFKLRGWYDPNSFERTKVRSCSNGGSSFIYILEDNELEREALIIEVREALRELKGISRIFEPEEFSGLGVPGPGEFDDQRPDFILEGEPECYLHWGHEGTETHVQHAKFFGMHGYLPSMEAMKAIFVAAGPTIKQGAVIPEIKLIDIAPTIAHLVGTTIADADGRVLNEILRIPPQP